MAHGQIQGIAGLVGVHEVLVVLNTGIVALRIIERQIYIVGKVGEDIVKMFLQGVGKPEIRLRGQLGRELCRHVSHQPQLIVQLRLLLRLNVNAVAQILVDALHVIAQFRVGIRQGFKAMPCTKYMS